MSREQQMLYESMQDMRGRTLGGSKKLHVDNRQVIVMQ